MSEIIVGIDESPGAQDALEFAARLADVSGASLRLASAFPYSDSPSRVSSQAYRRELESRAEALLDRTAEAVYVARGVDSPFFGVLYDIYHSAVEGEDMAAELENAGDLIAYVQLADAPGRGEPGSGSLDWAEQLGILRASGYDGPIGLEYYPTQESAASVAVIRELAAEA